MHHLFEHWGDVLTGAAGTAMLWSLLGYAVNTAPTPSNPWWQWLLGIAKFAVGQHRSAMNAIQGKDTAVMAVPQGTGKQVTEALKGTGSGISSSTESTNIENVSGAIRIATEKVQKTETVVPTPAKLEEVTGKDPKEPEKP